MPSQVLKGFTGNSTFPQKVCFSKSTVPAKKALLKDVLPATLSRGFELAQKEVATGWDTQKVLRLPALAAHAEGAPKPSFGFNVREVESSLNAFPNCGVLIARSGTSAWSLWLLSVMHHAGQESV